MRLPCKSCTVRIGEASGTASTQRVGAALALLNGNSQSTSTCEPFSSIQSLPVSPASRKPCSTYRLISCARRRRTCNSGSSMLGLYERLAPLIWKPALAKSAMVASCKLPLGRPMLRTGEEVEGELEDTRGNPW